MNRPGSAGACWPTKWVSVVPRLTRGAPVLPRGPRCLASPFALLPPLAGCVAGPDEPGIWLELWKKCMLWT